MFIPLIILVKKGMSLSLLNKGSRVHGSSSSFDYSDSDTQGKLFNYYH